MGNHISDHGVAGAARYEVAFAGDWHANARWACHVLQSCAQRGVHTLYQVGDFGFWPRTENGRRFLHEVNAAALERNITVRIVFGNHEDYHAAQTLLKPIEEGGWLGFAAHEALRFAPYAHTWVDDYGTRFASVAGAGSPDKNQRTTGTDWFPEEEITDERVTALLTQVEQRGWPDVDVLLTHDAPACMSYPRSRPSGPLFPPEVEYYCHMQRVRLQTVLDTLTPQALVHGHWHHAADTFVDAVSVHGTAYRSRIIGLAGDGAFGNTIGADTAYAVGLSNIQTIA